MKEAKRIPVQSDGSPVVAHVPVELYSHSNSLDSAIVEREALTITASTPPEFDSHLSLEDWAEYLSPSIERLLSSSEHRFMAKAITIEREVSYRERQKERQGESFKPRRVRVTRRRVTLFGTVRDGQLKVETHHFSF